MRSRCRSLFITLLSVVGLCMSVSTAKATVILVGDPSCLGVNCSISNIAPTLIEDGLVGDSEVFRVGLRDMQHIAMPGDDFGLLTVNVVVTLVNPSEKPAEVALAFSFTDENGDPIGPMLTGFSDTLDPKGLLNQILNRQPTAAYPDFEFHGFDIEVACVVCDGGPVDLRHVEVVELNSGGGVVGVWGVPEPTTLALMAIGLAGLGFARRRRLH